MTKFSQHGRLVWLQKNIQTRLSFSPTVAWGACPFYVILVREKRREFYEEELSREVGARMASQSVGMASAEATITTCGRILPPRVLPYTIRMRFTC